MVLRASDIARRYGVDRRTALRWHQAGLLPSFETLGGQMRVRSEDLPESVPLRTPRR